MKISCILPVYNEGPTVTHVLKILTQNKQINEIIVLDDGSRDDSVKKILEFKSKIIFIQNEKNLGKGATVIRGLNAASGDVILLCDADLTKLKQEHIDNLINTFKTGEYDMVIAAREKDFERMGIKDKLLATVSGERIFWKDSITEFYDLIGTVGNGMEQVINFAHKDKAVKIISSKGIGHINKHEKVSLNNGKWSIAYIKEGWEFLKADLNIKKKIFWRTITIVFGLFAALFSFWYFKTKSKRNKK